MSKWKSSQNRDEHHTSQKKNITYIYKSVSPCLALPDLWRFFGNTHHPSPRQIDRKKKKCAMQDELCSTSTWLAQLILLFSDFPCSTVVLQLFCLIYEPKPPLPPPKKKPSSSSHMILHVEIVIYASIKYLIQWYVKVYVHCQLIAFKLIAS